MTKGMRKDFRREIKISLSRFLSITLIVVLGVAFFSGIRAGKPAMQASADAQYDHENLMDIRVVGTLGVTENDVNALKEVDGVADAEGAFEQDFLCASDVAEVVTKVLSLTDRINLIKVTQGRYPEKYNECIADQEFLDATGYNLGDTVKLTTGTDEKYSQYLETDEFTIVGVGSTAYYLNQDRGTSTIGSGMVNGFIVVPREAFTLSCYTQIFVTAADAAALQSYSADYTELIDRIQNRISLIASDRCDIRYLEYQDETEDYIAQARLAYQEEKDQALTALADAYQQLLDAEAAITANETDLENKKIELESARALLNSNADDLVGSAQKIEDAEEQLRSIQAQCDALAAQIEASSAEVDEMQAYINEHGASMTEEEYFDKNLTLLAAKSTLQIYKTQLAQSQAAVTSAQRQIADTKAYITNGSQAIVDAKARLEAAPAAIEEAEKQLADARIELERKKEDYELAKTDMAEEFADAETKLTNTEAEILNVEKPEWHVLDRESISAYTSFQNDANGVGSIGTVFPVIFFLVAALVSLTTMTRMVEEERTQIGTLKALGYSKGAIATKYVFYALFASLLGSVLGVALGESTLPALVIHTYKLVYVNLRYSVVPFNIPNAAIATALAVVCTTGAAWAACYRAMREAPSSLMRPEAPKAGKRIFIEKIKFIWLRLNFAQKAALRNLFRYKKRLFMTMFGVAGCMALLLVGFGINDSIRSMTGNQFDDVLKYQGTVSVDTTASRAEKRQMLSDLNSMNGVSEYLQSYRSITYVNSPSAEKNAYIVVPQDTVRMLEYVSMSSRTGRNNYTLDDSGVILTEKLAKMLDVSVGDTITFKTSEAGVSTAAVSVSGIVENYIYHYIYMTPNVYQQLFNETAALNSILIKTDGSVDDATLTKNIMDLRTVNGITMNSTMQEDVNDVMKSLLIIVFVLIASAGLLAFVVLYNLNNINITERKRELATLKVLGFYDKELAAYVYRENIVLTLFGIVFGIILGILLHMFVMQTVETDTIMFGKVIKGWSYLFSILLTVGFSALVNWVMYFRLKKINMVESLKSSE